jgi:hypothetical protein
MKYTHLKFDRIDNIKPGPGFLLVKPGPENDHLRFKTDDGAEMKLYIDNSYEPFKHAVTWGTVMGVPDYLPDDSVTMDARVGDRVFMKYLAIPNAIRDNAYVIISGEPYFIIPYELCYCVKDVQGNVMPLNGWVLVSAIAEDVKINVPWLEVADFREKKHSIKEGIVKYVGTPLKGEKNLAKPGDRIIYVDWSDVPLQYHLHNDFSETMFRMTNEDILCVLN